MPCRPALTADTVLILQVRHLESRVRDDEDDVEIIGSCWAAVGDELPMTPDAAEESIAEHYEDDSK